jgi:16S rRNA processing protein RimM
MARREQLPPTDEDEYYWFELIGLNVFDSDDRRLGVLEEIITTGANDVYVVRSQNAEVLIPAIGSVVKRIDLQQGVMRVDLPKGL